MNNLKVVYCTPEQVLKDNEFCSIVDELLKNPQVSILTLPERISVRCKRRYNLFGKIPSHVGYENHYIVFIYKGCSFSLRSISPNPFEDRKPGNFYFLPEYDTRNSHSGGKIPNRYYIKYRNLKSIDDWYAYNEKRMTA